ncbi:GEM-like protein 5 [Oryza brachyantha]|uniref:GEM-like protein 5 n=1 Tax=Oryza brachyantha TaxID=4533 RepID=UPI001ADC3893|nr:GEM-like protein 5 [Oryza brachyantha]
MDGKDATPAAAAAAPAAEPQAPQPQPEAAEKAKWGTRQMGPPAAPGAHPENQQAARWTAARGDQELPLYVIMGEAAAAAPARGRAEKGESPMEHILDFFNTWSRKAEELASNIWLNLKTAPSMSEAAMGKLSLGAKALTEGGFEKLYRQTFAAAAADERLRKAFACYLSTATGPVAGTLYLTDRSLAFCSDRPLSFTAPSGQAAWSYYKVMVPLARVAAVEPVAMPERYVRVATVDAHEFWFMGFVSYDKAVRHLSQAVSEKETASPPTTTTTVTPAAAATD